MPTSRSTRSRTPDGLANRRRNCPDLDTGNTLVELPAFEGFDCPLHCGSWSIFSRPMPSDNGYFPLPLISRNRPSGATSVIAIRAELEPRSTIARFPLFSPPLLQLNSKNYPLYVTMFRSGETLIVPGITNFI